MHETCIGHVCVAYLRNTVGGECNELLLSSKGLLGTLEFGVERAFRGVTAFDVLLAVLC